MSLKKIWLAAMSVAMSLSAPAWPASQTEDPNAFMKKPEWLGTQYVGQGEWSELEAMLARLSSTGERDRDGQFELYGVTLAINNYLAHWNESQDEDWHVKFEQYREAFPDSSFQPIVTAMQLRSMAFRVRGAGFSTPEGDALYRTRITKA